MVDSVNKQELAQNYGFALAFFKSNPELWHLFNKAVKQTWTADRFVAMLRGTDWFKKHSASVRQAIMQETADPATYAAEVDGLAAQIKDVWGSKFGGAPIGDKSIRAWAETAKKLGWNDSQVMDHLVGTINFSKMLKRKDLGGAAADTEAQLRALSNAFGVDLGDKWRASQVGKIMKGNDTIEGVTAQVREMAMREYKAFADEIAGGKTVDDIAAGYKQKMASLLEMNPDEISVYDKNIQAALKQRTADGKPAAMDLADFADYLRQDKRWQYTDNAKEQVSGVVSQLARAFGTAG